MRKINSSDPRMTPRVKKALAHARKTTAAAAGAPPTAPPTTPTTAMTGSARKPAARSATTKAGAAAPAKPSRGKPAPAKPAGRGSSTGPEKAPSSSSGRSGTTVASKPPATAAGKSAAIGAPTKPPARPPAPPASNGKARLRPGALRDMVAEHLTANPKIQFTSSQLGNVLRRSSGAIANALVTLCELGTVVQTSDRPRTYQAARPKSGRRRAR